MKLNRLGLLTALLIASVVTVTGPATASAAVWKEKGVNVMKQIELGLTGGFEVATFSPLGSVLCEAHATLTTSGGSVALITKFERTNCVTFGSGLTKCSVQKAESLSLPWSVKINTADLTIANLSVKTTFQAGCASSEQKGLFPSVTMTPDSTFSITQFLLFGKNAKGDETGGEMKVDYPNSGLYGIG